MYNVDKLPTSREEATATVCKGEYGTLKKFKEREECFLKCKDTSDKAEKVMPINVQSSKLLIVRFFQYCDEMTNLQFPESSTDDP